EPAGDEGNGRADVYLNGTFLDTFTREDMPDYSNLNRIVFGDNTVGSTFPSDVQYFLARFETGHHIWQPPVINVDSRSR
ncbi:MAG: hypothetical protein NTX52_13375, partial [Planctomycetota bacterium]|nr:hypothetical protein [Planctomycetota bacterium]